MSIDIIRARIGRKMRKARELLTLRAKNDYYFLMFVFLAVKQIYT